MWHVCSHGVRVEAAGYQNGGDMMHGEKLQRRGGGGDMAIVCSFAHKNRVFQRFPSNAV
jgi:hypothetical protein